MILFRNVTVRNNETAAQQDTPEANDLVAPCEILETPLRRTQIAFLGVSAFTTSM